MCKLLVCAFIPALFALPLAAAEPLPNTKPLEEKGDLARLMVDGIHTYLDRELAAAPKKREELWKADLASKEALAKSLPAKRERLKKLLGVVDQRAKSNLEYVGGPGNPALLAEVDGCKIYAVRWAVLKGVDAEGLLIEPKDKPTANVIAIPHADQTPELFAGIVSETRGEDYGLQLALHGCRVLIPTLIDRKDEHSGNARLNRWTNYTHREWIHRMAYEMGRTVTGYEVQKVLAAVDWFTLSDDKLKIGVIGYGDGGGIALYAAALDPRITAIQEAGYFQSREVLPEQPIDRNVWGLLKEFGDAELATMLYPQRNFIGVQTLSPLWDGQNLAKPGRGGSAPGKLVSHTHQLKAEHSRYGEIMEKLDPFQREASVYSGPNQTNPIPIEPLLRKLGIASQPVLKPSNVVKTASNPAFQHSRHNRQFDQLAAFTQNLWRNSEPVRKDYWKKADASSPEKWEASCEPYRQHFHEEAIGKLPEPTVPLNPRSRAIYDEPKWTGHEVTLDVYPDVFAYGILLLPKGMKPGEKRPVVVCQHGLEGRPTDVCNPKEKTKYYNSFGARLADQGYIVFAPQNPYIFDTHFRQILRKANPLKLSLFSFIIRQHQRIIDWLEMQPNVDPKKIAFYGLSYGGKTAMRVPAVEKRYCLSICAGDFNEWIGKIVSTELPMSYMFTKEYDMLEFDLGHTYNYAEMANLIAPRPFMVERGHDDGVGIDEMIAYEYAKVRYLYANRLKIPDRTAIEFSVGGHEIFLKGTLAFLERHLGRVEPLR